jgi:hypothetical protein
VVDMSSPFAFPPAWPYTHSSFPFSATDGEIVSVENFMARDGWGWMGNFGGLVSSKDEERAFLEFCD